MKLIFVLIILLSLTAFKGTNAIGGLFGKAIKGVSNVFTKLEEVTLQPAGEALKAVERVTLQPLGKVLKEVEKGIIRPLPQEVKKILRTLLSVKPRISINGDGNIKGNYGNMEFDIHSPKSQREYTIKIPEIKNNDLCDDDLNKFNYFNNLNQFNNFKEFMENDNMDQENKDILKDWDDTILMNNIPEEQLESMEKNPENHKTEVSNLAKKVILQNSIKIGLEKLLKKSIKYASFIPHLKAGSIISQLAMGGASSQVYAELMKMAIMFQEEGDYETAKKYLIEADKYGDKAISNIPHADEANLLIEMSKEVKEFIKNA